MFEQLLYEYIKENFKVEGFNLSFGYGEIEPKTKEPYIIQYSLGMDGSRQVLCNEDNYTDGESFTQWNIYTGSQSTADFIYQQLFTFVEGIKQLGDYKIGLNQYNSSRTMTNPDIGLYSSILAMQIQYYK